MPFPDDAIRNLPDKLFPLAETKRVRSVFIRAEYQRLWRPDDFDVEIQPGERIISVETIPPNSAIGAGVRVWIEEKPRPKIFNKIEME